MHTMGRQSCIAADDNLQTVYLLECSDYGWHEIRQPSVNQASLNFLLKYVSAQKVLPDFAEMLEKVKFTVFVCVGGNGETAR